MTRPRPSRTASRPGTTVRRACTRAPRPIPTVAASIAGNVNVTRRASMSLPHADDDASATRIGVTVSAGASLGASVATGRRVSQRLGRGRRRRPAPGGRRHLRVGLEQQYRREQCFGWGRLHGRFRRGRDLGRRRRLGCDVDGIAHRRRRRRHRRVAHGRRRRLARRDVERHTPMRRRSARASGSSASASASPPPPTAARPMPIRMRTST